MESLTFLFSNKLNSRTIDKFAIFLSGMCLLHCLLPSVLITLLPVMSSSNLVDDELFHQLLLWFVLPTSFIAFFLGCRYHMQLTIVGIGITGISILVAVAFLGHDWLSSNGEKVATSTGGLVLALSHFLNYRACQDKGCGETDCDSYPTSIGC